MNGRLLCYVRGFTQLPQKRKAATYFEGPGGHGRPLLAGSYVTQRVRLAYSKPGTSTGRRQTGCGKTVFILDLLEGPYRGFFRYIVVLCPTIEHNKTYKQCPWLWTDPEVYILDPGERLQDYLQAFYLVFKGEPTLFIIDDCSATKALTEKKDMLSELAFSGRHAEISI